MVPYHFNIRGSVRLSYNKQFLKNVITYKKDLKYAC